MTNALIGKIALNSELQRVLFDDVVEASKRLGVSLGEVSELQKFFVSPEMKEYTTMLNQDLQGTHHKGHAIR
jgi:hypothetical protein